MDSRLPFAGLLLLLSSCGKDDDANCGPGTYEEDGVCLPDDDDADGDADDGTATDGGTDGGTNDGSDGGADGGADDGTDGGTDGGTEVDYTICDDGVAPFTSLQEAIDAASEGDTITLCAGHWEGAVIADHGVTIQGVDGKEETHIYGATATALTVEDQQVTITGVTLRGSYADPPHPAALLVEGGDVELVDARVAEVTGYSAIIATSGDLLVEGVVFEDNQQSNGYLLSFDGGGEIVVRQSIVRDNVGGSDPFVIVQHTPDASITNNLFINNVTGEGALVQFSTESEDAIVANNVFYANRSTYVDAYDPARVAVLGRATFTNNILLDNDFGEGSRPIIKFSERTRVSYNAASGNLPDDFSTPMSADARYGDGNLEVDPQFADPENGDFSLLPTYSPCIDQGNPDIAFLDPDGTRSDMGAYGGPDGNW